MIANDIESGSSRSSPIIPPTNQVLNEDRVVDRGPVDIASACFKQYWPTFSYLGSLTGLAIGQYGLQNWIFTAGSAGVGLVVTLVGSYFFGRKENVVDPRLVLRYQKEAADNMVRVDAAERRIQRILELGKVLKAKLAAGENSIEVNSILAHFEIDTLQTLNADAKAASEQFGNALREEKELELTALRLNDRGARDVKTLEETSDLANRTQSSLTEFLATRQLQADAKK